MSLIRHGVSTDCSSCTTTRARCSAPQPSTHRVSAGSSGSSRGGRRESDLQRPSHRPRPSRAGAQPEQSLPHRSGRRRRGERRELTLEVGDGGRRHPPAGGAQRLAGGDQEGLPALQAEDGVPLAIQLERHSADVRVLARQVQPADLVGAQQHVGESAEQEQAGVGHVHPHLTAQQAARVEQAVQIVVVAPAQQPARLELPVRRHPQPQPGHLLPGGLDGETEAGVGEHGVPEREVPAGESGLVAGDLYRHQEALPPDPMRPPLARHHSVTVRAGTRTVQPVDRASVSRRGACRASSSARVMAVVPASSASWVRQENPSASTTASGWRPRRAAGRARPPPPRRRSGPSRPRSCRPGRSSRRPW